MTGIADEYVNGYERSNGTYVQGYERTSPNATRTDNYSTSGNVNPYTGSVGHENPNAPSGSGSEQRSSNGTNGSGANGNGGSAGSLGSYGR